MTTMEFKKGKVAKAKDNYTLTANILADEKGVIEAKRLVASTLGVIELKQFEALMYLLAHLEGANDVYLGSVRKLSAETDLSRKTVTSMLELLRTLDLVKVETGFIRVDKELYNLFNAVETKGLDGSLGITLNINMEANQTELDI